MANTALASKETRTNNAQFRQGIITFLNCMLHEHGAYEGFRYLHASDLEDPTNTPGINDSVDTDVVAKFANTDSTRVQFI
jgi:hypothetical protein